MIQELPIIDKNEFSLLETLLSKQKIPFPQAGNRYGFPHFRAVTFGLTKYRCDRFISCAKANEKYPNNEAKLSGLGCTLSKEKQALPIPGKVMNGSAVQSEHSGKANMHWKSEPNAKIYFVMETTSTDIMNESKYYPANPTSFDNSKGGEVTPKTLGVPVWWRVYAHNASGDGVWSDPFGGLPIS